MGEEFEKIDIVISSTAAPHHILDRPRLEPLMHLARNRPLLLIDIAVPRDIDPEVNVMENVYLYNIDDLQTVADEYLKQRKEEIARCEAIIAEKVKALLAHAAPHRPMLQMNNINRSVIVATRGSALALAQANLILAQCRAVFPKLRFELKIIKTTGDKIQKASMAQKTGSLPKGLFTKELEVALVKRQADLAVHSLKDLPTDFPAV